MRNRRFVAVHRGGLLTPEQHKELMAWALECLKAADGLNGRPLDPPLLHAREAALAWLSGALPTGALMQAAREVHRFARTLENPVERAVARAFGHAAATAHASDHAMGVPIYLAKAFRAAGLDGRPERARELELLESLSEDLGMVVAETLYMKEHPKNRTCR
jgi:hypothetical protein